jgi:septum formation protein
LNNAGIPVIVNPASIDESAVKKDMRRQGLPVESVAIELAARKAHAVAAAHPGALVIGADQILEAAGAWLDKPGDRAAAERQLTSLAGRTHRLVSGAAIVQDGHEIWRHADTVTMHMRALSPAFISSYLDRVGDAATTSVGAYQIENLGAQLFNRIDGDFFTVLGLPLLPLLAFLRQRGIIAL